MGGLASAYGQAVAAHRTARGHLDAARRALDPADQPIAPADLVARLARLGDALATPTPLPGTPPCVRIGSAATPDGDFPALVPLGAGHHLVLDTDAGDPRVAGLLRAVLLRLLAAAPPGGVRVAVLDPAGRDRPEPGRAGRDRPEPGPDGRDRPGPGPDGRDHAGPGPDGHDAAGADPAWTGFAGPLRPLVDLGVLMPSATGAAEVDALLDTVQRHAGAVDPGRELLVVVAASVGGTAAARLAALTERGPAAAVCVLAAGWPATEPPPGSATQVRLAERYAHVGDPPGVPFSADGSGLAAPVLLDGDPPAAEVAALAKRLSAPGNGVRVAALAERLSAPGNGVEVAALLPERRWTGSAAGGLRTVIGRAGPEPVAAALDRATPHWLVDGSAGRASFLLTVVHGLVARYAPAELQLHLLDVTGRAGFADLVPTAGDPSWLPHARTVGIGPDREYGVAVLRDLRRELRRRVAARKRHGVAAAADQPRIVAVVDGFEALLAGDDTLAREATDLLVELVRAGGPVGMHLVLAGPNPPGALPGRVVAALGRFALRVALPRDAVDDPPAGSALLSAPPGATRAVAGRPATGPVRLPDAQAAAGELVRLRRELWQARPAGSRPPSFFAGDATVRVEEDATFAGLRPGGRRPLALVGRTVDVDGTSALFIMDAAPGRHLAVVGASATGAAVLRAATLSLARQHAPGDARFLLAPLTGATDSAAEDTAATLAAAGHPVVRLDAVGLRAHIAALFPGATSSPPAGPGCGPAGGFAASAPAGRTYLVVFGADAAHQVLATADPETGRTGHDDLRALLRHGPGHGAHLLGWWRGIGPLARDLGDTREPEDLACLVALDVPGDELGTCLGLPDLWSPRPGRALLVDRHDQRTRLIVPFTGRELDREG
ncbi:FtsK/SpoIIIE family protein [Micromonospora echinaurantiaca]|uniref:FtsK/SpoIIIE family protein n=1 Tax=Micromonospora echinaurantiaca TaxID=47857 RepID=A0A1C5H8P5_9ACTN|nr:FtsK/SpoIIIE domain-containing protein [Micromonospora echinaurantiaca]SCG42313.1 FtsK/SpoIIIE family protein [Micromonospora echinaurantiaca]